MGGKREREDLADFQRAARGLPDAPDAGEPGAKPGEQPPEPAKAEKEKS